MHARFVRLSTALLILSVVAPVADARKHGDKATVKERPPEAATKERPPKAAKAAKVPPKAKIDPTCKEPAPKDADLAAGLAAYSVGKWPDAVTSLTAFAAKPDADKDPAAGRGFYCLGYAQRATGDATAANAAMGRAEPLLKARMAATPSLEAAYYLQAIYQTRGDRTNQLAVVASALKDLEAGTMCARPDADDMFRHARLLGFNSQRAEQLAVLGQAAAAYEAANTTSPYRAFAEMDLGMDKLDLGDAAAALPHLATAAHLDPTLLGVHTAYGRALLQTGRLAEASEWWKDNWRKERDTGNALIYAIPVIDDVLRLQPKVGDQGVKDIGTYLVPALEENMEQEAKSFLALVEKQAEAKKGGGDLTPEDALAMDVAEYRMAQLMVDYVARGNDLQEFALQKGLLPAIHHRDLPKR